MAAIYPSAAWSTEAQHQRREEKHMATPDITAIIREMVNAAVDERMGQLDSIADAMVRAHGEFIKVNQAAKLLNVTPQTILRMCNDGRLVSTTDGSALVMVRSMVNMVKDGDVNNLRKPNKPRQYSCHRIEA